jgi:hypothetical protein
LLQSCLCPTQDVLLPTSKDMHPFFESLEVFGPPCLHAYMMNVHHDTSFRSILYDDSIFSTSKTRIRFYSCKGARLCLIVRPSICLFCIARFTFISVLRFHFDLIQPSPSIFFTCECGHMLNTCSMHLACCPFGG